MLNTNLLTHSLKERVKKKRDKENTFNQPKIENYLMDFMSAYFVLAVNQLAHLIGGIHRIISVQLFLCKLIDGLLIQEMNIPMRDSKNLEAI